MILTDNRKEDESLPTTTTISRTCHRILTFIPARAWIVVLLVFSIVAMQISRMNISLAVVAMMVDVVPGTDDNISLSSIYLCPAPNDPDPWLDSDLPLHPNVTVEDVDVDTLEVHYEEEDGHPLRLRDQLYSWSDTTQSCIYLAYFFSYLLSMVPGGLYATKLGSKLCIAGCLLVSALISLVIPFVTDHTFAFITMRLLLGVVQGALLPSAVGVVARWVPVQEQSLCFALIEVSMYGASILTFGAAGWVNEEFGWPGLFFVPGVISFIAFIPDIMFLKDSPPTQASVEGDNPSSLQEGKETSSDEEADDCRPPVKEILTNIPVLTCGFFKIAHNWNITIIQGSIPMYLERVTHEDVSSNGYSNAGIYACMVTGLLLSGSLSDYLINHNITSRIGCRKLMSLVSGAAVAVTLFLIPAAGCDSRFLHIVLFLNSFCCGFYAGSDSPLPAEMSKKYPSFVYAVVTAMSILAGLIEPAFTGFTLDHMQDKWMAWCIIFWVGGFFTILSNIIFLVGASCDRQPFDYHGEEKGKHPNRQ